ncbi:MAG: DUF6088 family protein [Bacteroidales bacterium]|jgi:hypothetical protein|nr:DUF6088 family protein [Bacteroidales bacterium]
MQSTVNKIENEIKRRRRGRIYFADDFTPFGTSEAIKKALLRFEKSGMLIRLAHGIYLYPSIDKRLGLGVLYPSVEDVAKEIARRDKARIVPTGLYALNVLGLSTQVPANIVYLTDGAPRKIKIYSQSLTFKHVVPKKLAYKSEILMLIVSALTEIGEQRVTDSDINIVKKALLNERKENIQKDLKLAPIWIRNIIQKII